MQDYFEQRLKLACGTSTPVFSEKDGTAQQHMANALNSSAEKESIHTSLSATAGMSEDNMSLESQILSRPNSSAPPEYSTSFAMKLLFLGVYFVLNLGLTLSNKAVMQRVSLITAMS